MPDDLTRAYEALAEAARPLRRCNVRAYASSERGLVVDLCGGSIFEWKAFWHAVEEVERLRPQAPKPPKARVLIAAPPPLLPPPKPKRQRVQIRE